MFFECDSLVEPRLHLGNNLEATNASLLNVPADCRKSENHLITLTSSAVNNTMNFDDSSISEIKL